MYLTRSCHKFYSALFSERDYCCHFQRSHKIIFVGDRLETLDRYSTSDMCNYLGLRWDEGQFAEPESVIIPLLILFFNSESHLNLKGRYHNKSLNNVVFTYNYTESYVLVKIFQIRRSNGSCERFFFSMQKLELSPNSFQAINS